MIDDRVVFEEKYIDPIYWTATLYFNAPKDLFSENYPEADYMTIAVQIPEDSYEARYAQCMYSPTLNDSDYDWNELDLPYEDIDKLLVIANRAMKVKEK